MQLEVGREELEVEGRIRSPKLKVPTKEGGGGTATSYSFHSLGTARSELASIPPENVGVEVVTGKLVDHGQVVLSADGKVFEISGLVSAEGLEKSKRIVVGAAPLPQGGWGFEVVLVLGHRHCATSI